MPKREKRGLTQEEIEEYKKNTESVGQSRKAEAEGDKKGEDKVKDLAKAPTVEGDAVIDKKGTWLKK